MVIHLIKTPEANFSTQAWVIILAMVISFVISVFLSSILPLRRDGNRPLSA